jgi:hypothetical protein
MVLGPAPRSSARSRNAREAAKAASGTLAHLKVRGMGLFANCTGMHCGHGQELNLDMLIKRFGAGYVYINDKRIAAACRCAKCGQKGATLRVRADTRPRGG